MRYTLRKQDDGSWCIWDKETDAPAVQLGFRFINLEYDKAVDERDRLNSPND
jgi:hypothetical protein